MTAAMAATTTAAAVRAGTQSARATVQASLATIAATDGRVNAFTAVLAERALKRADLVDASPRRSRMRLAGVPPRWRARRSRPRPPRHGVMRCWCAGWRPRARCWWAR